MNISPTLTVDGKSYELLCGPFNKYEEKSLQRCISGLGKIAYEVIEVNGEKYVYRDAKGYIRIEEQQYDYKFAKPNKYSADKLFISQIMKEVRDGGGWKDIPKRMEPMMQMH